MINIEVYQVIKESDDSYTASLNFIDSETTKIIQKRTVNASNLVEFKDQIRVFKTKIEQIEADKQTLMAIVQRAIDEIMAE